MLRQFEMAKIFLKSIAKLSAALFIALTSTALLIYGYISFTESQTLKEEEKYETLKDWMVKLDPIDMTAYLKTKVVRGEMFVQFDLRGYPEWLRNPSLALKNRDEEFILQFNDKDGFKIYERRVKLSEFTTVLNDKGEKKGLSFQFTESLLAKKYGQFHKAKVGWTIEVNAPAALTKPAMALQVAKPNSNSVDHCAPEISRSERLRRLALSGVIRQSGANSFSVGSKTISFFSDGSVIYCN
jgi:hypothetical protein